MNNTQKRFIWYAVLAVFLLLTVLLGILNAVGFTMAAQDADRLTQIIAQDRGVFGPQNSAGQRGPMAGGFGPMGPDSPETRASLRYFTCVFDQAGQGRVISYQISAVTEQEALRWAQGLARETTGWTRGTYRYRVYERDGLTYVTVVDQGRELLSAYRILILSGCGLVVFTLLSFIILRLVGRRLFAPIEEADRKQKQFIAQAEQELKLPLTVIRADTELLERQQGPSEQTRSIHRQLRKMAALVRRLGSLAIYEDSRAARVPFSLSSLVQGVLDRRALAFERRGLALEAEVEPGIDLTGSPEGLERVVTELLDNALKYGESRVVFTLRRENSRIQLRVSNDAQLPEGPCDQVFDRFTLLSNAPEGAAGLGLAAVKDLVKAQGGRVSARVEDGWFLLKINL